MGKSLKTCREKKNSGEEVFKDLQKEKEQWESLKTCREKKNSGEVLKDLHCKGVKVSVSKRGKFDEKETEQEVLFVLQSFF